MHDLEQIKNLVPTVEILLQSETISKARQHAFNVAKKHTNRTKLLMLENTMHLNSFNEVSEDFFVEVIPAGDTAQLCKAIANSTERLAAIVVKYTQATPYYYKKVRELTSAEGAVMIWDELDNKLEEEFNLFKKISKTSQPDIVCFSLIENKNTIWLGGKKSILQEDLK